MFARALARMIDRSSELGVHLLRRLWKLCDPARLTSACRASTKALRANTASSIYYASSIAPQVLARWRIFDRTQLAYRGRSCFNCSTAAPPTWIIRVSRAAYCSANSGASLCKLGVILTKLLFNKHHLAVRPGRNELFREGELREFSTRRACRGCCWFLVGSSQVVYTKAGRESQPPVKG